MCYTKKKIRFNSLEKVVRGDNCLGRCSSNICMRARKYSQLSIFAALVAQGHCHPSRPSATATQARAWSPQLGWSSCAHRAPTDQARKFCIVTREQSLLLSAEHGDFSFPRPTCQLETVSLPPALLTKTPNRTTRVHQLQLQLLLLLHNAIHTVLLSLYQLPATHSGIFPREGRLCNFGGTHKIHKRFLTESSGSTWVRKEQRINVETVHTHLF